MRTRVGYTGGGSVDPTYHDLADHTEALQVDFDPDVLSFADVMALVFKGHDPTRGHFSRQYMAGVWCADDTQLEIALRAGNDAAREAGGKLVTVVEPLDRFYRAEDYHQKHRLRRERDLTAELVARYGSDRAMVDSTAAARINGWLRGYRDKALVAALGLSSESEALLRAS